MALTQNTPQKYNPRWISFCPCLCYYGLSESKLNLPTKKIKCNETEYFIVLRSANVGPCFEVIARFVEKNILKRYNLCPHIDER